MWKYVHYTIITLRKVFRLKARKYGYLVYTLTAFKNDFSFQMYEKNRTLYGTEAFIRSLTLPHLLHSSINFLPTFSSLLQSSRVVLMPVQN